MTVTVEYAAKHLKELLETVDGGDSVEIVRPDKPAVQLSGKPAAVDAAIPKKRVLGAGVGSPEAEALRPLMENWDEVDREWRASFKDGFGMDETC